jgi:mRNA interferase HicA
MVKGRQLVQRLRRAGVEIIPRRGKGGHWLAKFGERRAPVPMHGDTDLGPEFIKRICKQLGLDPDRIL